MIDLIGSDQRAAMVRYARLSEQTAYGTCQFCGKFTRALAYRRRGCAYSTEESNWMLSCPTCNADKLDYWHDMWDEYYSGIM